VYVGKTTQTLSARQAQHRGLPGRGDWELEPLRAAGTAEELAYWEQTLIDQHGGIAALENEVRAVSLARYKELMARFGRHSQ